MTKPKGCVTQQQLVRIQETFVRESTAANQRWMKKFREEEHQKQEALARAERAEQLLFEFEERTIEDEELQIQNTIEQNEKDALKQFEFEEVRILIGPLFLKMQIMRHSTKLMQQHYKQYEFSQFHIATNFRLFIH